MKAQDTQNLAKTAVLVETGDRSAGDLMSPARIRSFLRAHPDVIVLESESWSDKGSVDRIGSLCTEKQVTNVILYGPSSNSSLLPDVIPRPDACDAIPVTYAPIREHCLTAEPDTTAAEAKAERLLEMAVARANGASPAPLIEVPVERTVAVIGSNHAAYQMAAALVGNGFPVVLAETSRPTGCFFPLPDSLIRKVTSQPTVERLPTLSVDHVEGSVGAFQLQVLTPGGRRRIKAGAIVVAVDAQIDNLDLGSPLAEIPHLISLREYGERVNAGRTGDRSVCIWLDHNGPDRRCAGQAALHYCIEHTRNGGRPTVLFQNMPVYGHQGQVLYDRARAAGVTFIRTNGVPPRFASFNHQITVEVEDSVLVGRPLQFQVDRLVVPAPVVPSPHNVRLAALLHQPLDAQGYLQSGNVRHRPVGSARKGVFFVGGCHDECDPEEAGLEALAVLAELMAQLSPAGMRVPSDKVILDKGACAGCLTCLRMCPHGAIDPPPSGRWMEYYNAACYQCGICASVCPGQALQHGSLSFDQMHNMLQVAAADLSGRAPIVAFGCRQSAIPAADEIGRHGLTMPAEVLLIDVPCAGLVNQNMILDALQLGARGVLVLGCHHDNCRSMWGSDLARKRIDRVEQHLKIIGAEGRVRFSSLAANEPYRLASFLADATGQMPEGPIGPTTASGE